MDGGRLTNGVGTVAGVLHGQAPARATTVLVVGHGGRGAKGSSVEVAGVGADGPAGEHEFW
jgi:hypothetical protein